MVKGNSTAKGVHGTGHRPNDSRLMSHEMDRSWLLGSAG